MDITHWGRQHRILHRLLQQQQHWQQLQQYINQHLPPNLSRHCTVACVNDEGQLVIFAHNHLVTGRLKMLLPAHLTALHELDSNIRSIQIKMRPVNQSATRRIQRQFSEASLHSFQDAARRTAHHPELATALQRFALRRRKTQ